MDDDQTLTARLAADLDGAFEQFVRANADGVYSVALRLLGDAHEAEDVAQETFVRAYRSLARWPKERILELRPRPWLTRITLNLVRNRARVRRPHTQPLRDGTWVAPEAERPEVHAERVEATAAVTALLERLPERDRVAIVLKHVHGLGYPEVAEALGRPVGTVKAQVHRGLAKLREALGADDSKSGTMADNEVTR
jgi:RNA polymerase sigma-70 factor, ECF subfamily